MVQLHSHSQGRACSLRARPPSVAIAALITTLSTGLITWASLHTAVHAQPASPAPAPMSRATPDPLVAQTPVPALVYESPFARYRMLGDVKLSSWREANDTVARIGGWRVYLREAQLADVPGASTAPAPSATTVVAPSARPVAPSAPSAPPRAPTPAGHSGHKTP